MKALVTVFVLALATTSFASGVDCGKIYDDSNGKTPSSTSTSTSSSSTKAQVGG